MFKNKAKSTKFSLKSFLTSLDQYSYDVGFRENGSSSFGTTFGGLISITIFVCITIYAAKKGLDF